MGRYDSMLDAARRNGTLPTPRPAPRPEPPPEHRPSIWTPGYEDGPETPRRPSIVPRFKTVRELVNEHRELRPPIVDGLLRRGETMNMIGAPKIGKSWAATGLALCIQTGRPWLDRFPCRRGNVLIIDNELHGETSANRIPTVGVGMQIPDDEYADGLRVENLRGRLVDIFAMSEYFDAIEPGAFDVIILDAFYRFQPGGASENDNATMARIYNVIDTYADRLRCAFVLIHHSAKGNQSDKATTDVGAGAGAMSRAADAHLVMRAHEQEGCVVVDAVARSWPPVEPFGLRWEFPVFRPDDTLDPAALKRPKGPGEARQERNDKEGADLIVKALSEHGPSSRTRLCRLTGMTSGRVDRILSQIGDSLRRETSVLHGNPAEIYSLTDE